MSCKDRANIKCSDISMSYLSGVLGELRVQHLGADDLHGSATLLEY